MDVLTTISQQVATVRRTYPNWAPLAQRLLKEAGALLATMDKLSTYLQASGGKSPDPGDEATEVVNTALVLAELENAKRELQRITAAMRRMVSGGYGVCENCGWRIDQSRLEAFPAATLCHHCQGRVEAATPSRVYRGAKRRASH